MHGMNPSASQPWLSFLALHFLPSPACLRRAKAPRALKRGDDHETVTRSVANACNSVVSGLSGTLEFMVIKKLFDGVFELFSGFFELSALVFCFSLIFWVSGLFLGLAVCSVCLLGSYETLWGTKKKPILHARLQTSHCSLLKTASRLLMSAVAWSSSASASWL